MVWSRTPARRELMSKPSPRSSPPSAPAHARRGDLLAGVEGALGELLRGAVGEVSYEELLGRVLEEVCGLYAKSRGLTGQVGGGELPEEAQRCLLEHEGSSRDYGGLEVEEIGSAYEGLMGRRLERVEVASVRAGPRGVWTSLEALRAKGRGSARRELGVSAGQAKRLEEALFDGSEEEGAAAQF